MIDVSILQSVGDKIVAGIFATAALASGLFVGAQTMITRPYETATIYNIVASDAVESAVSVPVPIAAPLAATGTATITPNLLPIVTLLPQKKATSTKTKTVKTAIKVPATAIPPTPAPPEITPAPATPATPTITTQWLLDNTKLSLTQKADGTYEAVFTANTGTENLTWGSNDAFIGGSAGIPKFAFSISCAPPAETPTLDLPDQAIFFFTRTFYDCTIGFAATTGSDLKSQSKDLQFETGPGQLVVTSPSSMNVILTDDTNEGGFVFANQDSKELTIQDLTLDVSYTGLSTLSSPLVLRILDPASGTSLFDYHMETIPADPTDQYTHAATGINAPVNFTLKPASQKLLPIQILGVHRMSLMGTNPTVTITLTALTADQSDVPFVLRTSHIQWSCVVALSGYDPNATSGPFVEGTVCR